MMSTTLDTQGRTSPMMMQWCACKKQVGSALLLFRLGDFYEAFDLDAEILARELELTLTKRQDIPMAGIPAHTSEAYIDKLVAKGYHVAIAEQVEDPKVSKGLVKREIVRVVTPGTLIHSSLLADKSPNFVGYLVLNNHTFGLSLLDITTAECLLLEWEDFSSLCSELVRLQPKELLLTEKVSALYQIPLKELQEELQFSVTVKTERPPAYTYEFLTEHFGVRSLDCFGVEGMSTAIHAAGSLLLYVQDELHMPIHHIRTLRKENLSTYMSLDATTLRHLEILEPLQDRDGKGTLLHHLDQTKTPMGGRLLRHWLSRPLLSSHAIFERQEAIACLLSSAKLEPLRLLLHTIRDLERLIMKMETGFGGPKELVSLRLSLEAALQTLTLLQGLTSPLLQEQASKLCDLSSLVLCLQQSLVDNPPLRLHDGPVIREGYSAELDTLRNLCQDSHSWIAQYQTRLREETNIKTLKVSYTRAFGYYIEVSRAQAERMPASFQRRQTLVNAERFITQELKEYEYNVLSAEEKISGLEAQLFQELRIKASSHAKEILA
ncbi:MAG: DNA mismatch repair protein MutS, partial [Chlamydiae bacterium]|nr:DNA mismatch repair protein MutS [Chlamydiota bacterium]